MLRPNLCIGCQACLQVCPSGAIRPGEDGAPLTNLRKCRLCGACVDACYSGAREIVGREWTVHEVIAQIEKDLLFYDESGGGVTFSGGEPLMQPAFLFELLGACRQRGIHTTLDTCGFAPRHVLSRLSGRVDLFFYDLKSIDPVVHHAFTGVSNRLILSNLQQLSRQGNAIVVRLPLIPGVNDQPAHLLRLGEFVAALPHLERLDVLPYHTAGAEKYPRMNRTYALSALRPPSPEAVEAAVQLLQQFGFPVSIGG